MQDAVWVRPKVDGSDTGCEPTDEEPNPLVENWSESKDQEQVRLLMHETEEARTEVQRCNFRRRQSRRSAFLYSYQFTSRPESCKERLLRSLEGLHGSMKVLLVGFQREVSVRRLRVRLLHLRQMASSLVQVQCCFAPRLGSITSRLGHDGCRSEE